LREPERDGLADPATATGDDRDFAVQAFHSSDLLNELLLPD
jgi:hypothetical protein